MFLILKTKKIQKNINFFKNWNKGVLILKPRYLFSLNIFIYTPNKNNYVFTFNSSYSSYLNKFITIKNTPIFFNVDVSKNFFNSGYKINYKKNSKQKIYFIYVKKFNCNSSNFLLNSFVKLINKIYNFTYLNIFFVAGNFKLISPDFNIFNSYESKYTEILDLLYYKSTVSFFNFNEINLNYYMNNSTLIKNFIISNNKFFFTLTENKFLFYKFYKDTNNYNSVFLNSKINNFKNIFNFLIFLDDYTNFKKNLSFFSNKYLINSINIFNTNNINSKIGYSISKKKFHYFNNYYPIFFSNNRSYNSFFNKFKQTYNMNYINLLNKLMINFFELTFKKNVYMKVSNNYYYKIKNSYFIDYLNNYKNFQPHYFKNFLISDFLEIIWYSFFLKDLSMLSSWITNFMETLNFKNHKKFVIFFQNFVLKNSQLFIDVLKIKGFYFDIRGKVGVTGSSKKRHICFKIGSLKKSSKKNKIDFNQNLVRTYSGVLGLTYVMCY